ncbi:MAG: phosphotransferase, partial [Bacteroidales bacterium]|nr:phosphotransferase [Candidatus Colimorpha onthohippi]
GINYSHSYPRAAFDRQSMQWDLCYFKYYFLKLAYIPFDEQLLEDDFSVFTNYLLDQHCDYFMYRDFQSRNIMLTGDERMYYIDFQGGRQGAAQYDVASLLYSASTDIPEVVRKQLLNYYLEQVSPHLAVRGERLSDFTQRFYGYVLLRIMQALGAYGYRGYYERKDHFLKSIPHAVANLRLVIQSYPLPIRLPHLEKVWQAVVESPLATAYMAPAVADCLTITVVSFSYKQGLPQDTTGNGGGYVFDCRALPNPGRYPEYRNYTGADPCVIDFLKDDDAVISFLEHAKHIVMQSVLKYKERRFSHLMVAFGCTGGQHRSVYCAEQLAFSLRQLDGCKVVLCHREQQNNKK